MAGPEDFIDPSLFYQDTPAEQTDPKVEQQDPVVRPAPAEKPDSWVFDEAMLGYPENKPPTVEEALETRFYDGSKMGMEEPKAGQKTDKLSDKVVVVCDNGLFVEYAAVLARSFGKVYYHCASGNAYRKMTKGLIGTGVEGLEILEDDIWEVDPDKIDLWVFPDVNFGHLQEELRNRGYRVWGSGAGEAMENDRVGMKQDMAAQGMPVGEYEVVKGIDNLRVYLKENEDVFVKISKYRGSFESFHAKNYRVVEAKLDRIQQELGPLGKITEFIIEQPLPDRVEIGVDCWTVDGKYPKNIFYGIEVKDKSYCGAFGPLAKLPKPIHTVNKGLAPIFKKYGYRGPFSTEIRTNGPDDAYLIDMTCFSEDTEVLTEIGWELIRDIRGRKVLTISVDTESPEWQTPSLKIQKPSTEKMVRVGGEAHKLDFLVTLDHDILNRRTLGGPLEKTVAAKFRGACYVPTRDGDVWVDTSDVSIVDYGRPVYCLTVPNGTLYVRRNGKPFWSGNCRLPSPPNEIYQELYLNAAEIAWHGANGVMVEPKPRAKFGAQLVLSSTWCNENWQPVYFPKELREYVKLINQIVIDGVHYTSPQGEGLDSIGGVIGFGDTAEAAGEDALEHAKEIEGPGIDYSKDAIKEAIDAAKKAAEMGIKIF